MPRAAATDRPSSAPSPALLRAGRDRCRGEAVPCRSGRGPRRGRRSRCRRADGCAVDRSSGVDQRRRAHRRRSRAPSASLRTAVRACARSTEARLRRTAISDGGNVASRPGLGSGAAIAIVESRSRSISKAATIRSITALPWLSRDGGVGLITPLRSSRSRARVAPTWKRRSSSSASRFWASSQSSRSRRG